MNKFYICLCMVYAAVLSGCATSNGRYAVISGKSAELNTFLLPHEQVASGVEAESSRAIVLFMPFGETPTAEKAIKKLLEEYQGDYLANAQISHTSLNLLFWYNYSAWKVKADVRRLQP